MDYIFLHEYSADEKRHYCDVLDQCINRLPYTLASPIGNVCLEVGRENYGKAMNYMLDFFEISTQYLFCVLYAKLSGMYVKQGSARAVELHKFINRIDSKRPLAFGDWVNDLFCPIVGLAAKEFPDDALCKSLQANVVNRKKNILLGDKRNPSVVNIRNRYKGHTTTLSEALYHDVVFTLEERMLVMASALLPLTEWHFVSRSGDKCLLLNGMKPVEVPLQEIGAIMQPGHYYVSSKALADAGEEDLLDGFSRGIDDYVKKPFSIRELVVRIKSVLRRTKGGDTEQVPSSLTCNTLVLDAEKKLCTIDGEEVPLTKKEFEILRLFLQNRGRIFSREEILGKVWEEDVLVIDRTIDVNINRLRKKLKQYGNNIITKLGYGYGFKD